MSPEKIIDVPAFIEAQSSREPSCQSIIFDPFGAPMTVPFASSWSCIRFDEFLADRGSGRLLIRVALVKRTTTSGSATLRSAPQNKTLRARRKVREAIDEMSGG
jgi:hypothetical protein